MARTNPSLLRLQNDDVEEDPIITDEFAAAIVNEKREVMIDGKVVRYTEYGTLVYHDHFTESVEMLLETMIYEEFEGIYAAHDFEEDPFYEIEPGIFLFSGPKSLDEHRQSSRKIELSTANAAMIPWNSNPFNFPFCNRSSNKINVNFTISHWTGGIRETAYIYFENNRRMKAKAWSTNYASHSTSGYFTKLQRRTLGVWWASDGDIISISVRGNFYYPNPAGDDTPKTYSPFKLDPAQGNGYWNLPNQNEAKIHFGLITATIGISNNLQSVLNSAAFCDASLDFNANVNSFLGGNSKYCKPKWKVSNAVKIKESESCHYVKRGGYEGEIQIKIKVDA